ncbi:sugar transporter SWEET1 [Xenopus laevis]|uniref:Sugar transporter SWEET1 n=1 Tax=Xenopus laevis TaxID=8355 RepID=SWET1_XENLA|nr:sugar transporter SWEET1 [Xenopus laevis]Q6NTJ7.1 RecName: Full=Sugar transporter SWEET1; AltName: Full=Solute carrier family 50 member 1 [Xenopus laevis]AAH68964.1 Rag1ap1 protein [Xenopus laevis]
MDWMWLLSGACIVFTLGMFSSGLSDLRVMVAQRSVENIQYLPFLTTDLNNLGWFYYGYLKGDGTLMIVNVIGASLQSLYMGAYLLYSPERRYVGSQVLVSLGVLLLGYCYFTLWILDLNSRLNQLGLFCSVFTISMYLSPLADLAQIIRSKSTKCLSFPLTVATFLTSSSWVLYGLVQSDLYITVPNFPGIVTSLVRFWLFSQFPPDPPTYRLLQA